MTQKFVYSIGVAAFVRNGNTLLVGRRGKACSRGAGCLALPGGVVEHRDEAIVAAALREVLEETGLIVSPIPYKAMPFTVPGCLAVTDHFDIGQQQDGGLMPHLTLWIMTRYAGGVPVVNEPSKCEEWVWMTPKEIAALPGATNPTHQQHYWTPIPLWRQILRPYFGEF